MTAERSIRVVSLVGRVVLYDGPVSDLREADLSGADLSEADLRGADLREADLRGADLREADLRGADLYGADLYWADLRGADLRGARLSGADLRGTNLRGTNLSEANLYGARLNWESHDLLGEILRQAASDDPARRAWAGMVLVSRDWCWDRWAELAQTYPDLGGWARSVLLEYVRDGDGAPPQLTGGAS